MTYVIRLLPNAQKVFVRLPEHIRHRAQRALNAIAVDPYIGKKLHGEYEGQYTVRVWPYRIIYEIYKNQLIVLVVRIGHRQGVY